MAYWLCHLHRELPGEMSISGTGIFIYALKNYVLFLLSLTKHTVVAVVFRFVCCCCSL